LIFFNQILTILRLKPGGNLPVFLVKNNRILIDKEALRRLGLEDGDIVVISQDNEFIVVKRGNRKFQLGFYISTEEIDELIRSGARA